MRRASVAGLVVALAVAAVCAHATAKSPERIVALTPFSANTLANLGVKPIAIGQTLGGHDRFSRKLRGVERLTLSHPNGPNMEELAVLNPQLVFSSTTWRKGTQTMRDLEIGVVYADPGSIADLYAKTKAIGKEVGRAKQASKLVSSLRSKVAKARKGIRKHPKVMVVLGVGRTPYVALAESWAGDLVAKAGGRLMTGGVKGSGFQRISDEIVVEENPDVIIAIPHANAEDLPAIERFLKTNPAWKDTKAVRNDRLYISNDNSLLQAGTDVAHTLRKVRQRYLKN